MPKELDEKNFEEFIKKGLVLIDFWAPWCGPCRMLGPILDELEKEITYIKFGKVNVDQEANLAEKYQISAVPTLIIFKDGEEIDRRMGYGPKSEIRSWLEEYKQA